MAGAQSVGRRSSGHRVMQAEGSSPGGDTYRTLFFSNDFYFSFVSLMDFSDIVMLRSRPNSCLRQNLKFFYMSLLLSGLFS